MAKRSNRSQVREFLVLRSAEGQRAPENRTITGRDYERSRDTVLKMIEARPAVPTGVAPPAQAF